MYITGIFQVQGEFFSIIPLRLIITSLYEVEETTSYSYVKITTLIRVEYVIIDRG